MSQPRPVLHTHPALVRVVERGSLLCAVPDDPQAHVEVTVEGGALWIEVNGIFIHLELPKGFGVYQA